LLFLVDPIAFLLDAYRQVLMAGEGPDAMHLFAIGALSAAACLAMLAVMRRSSRWLALRAITA